LLRKRNTLRLNHAKMQAFCRGTRLVCFCGATLHSTPLRMTNKKTYIWNPKATFTSITTPLSSSNQEPLRLASKSLTQA